MAALAVVRVWANGLGGHCGDGWGWLGDVHGGRQTPSLESLAAHPLSLTRRHTPGQTGRNPIHVNMENISPQSYNKEDPVGGFQGIPRNMTGYVRHAAPSPSPIRSTSPRTMSLVGTIHHLEPSSCCGVAGWRKNWRLWAIALTWLESGTR